MSFQLLLSGDAQGGSDALLLSGDVQSGGDAEMINWTVVTGALVSLGAGLDTLVNTSGTIFTTAPLASQAAVVSAEGRVRVRVLAERRAARLELSGESEHLLLSGDMQAGGDLLLLSGDERSGGLVPQPASIGSEVDVSVTALAALQSGETGLDLVVKPILTVLAAILSADAETAAQAQTTDAMLAYAGLQSSPAALGAAAAVLLRVLAGRRATPLELSGEDGVVLLSGDMQAGGERLMLSGDEKSGGLRMTAAAFDAGVNALIRILATVNAGEAEVSNMIAAQIVALAALASERADLDSEIDLDNPHRRIVMPIYH